MYPKHGGGGDDDEDDATKNPSRYVRLIHAQVHLLVLKIIIGGGLYPPPYNYNL